MGQTRQRIMISYSRRDRAEVDSVLSKLARYGWHAWKDTDLQPEDWRANASKEAEVGRWIHSVFVKTLCR
jgi:hypothetical protein